MRRSRLGGFTLVEIMIVVAIVVLLSGIAIPNVLRARLNANETSAIAAMRTLSTAMETYRAAHTPAAYPTALSVLSSGTPPYINSVLGSGTKQGYIFTLPVVSGATAYTASATPVSTGFTGERSFAVTASGIITCNGIPIE